MLLWLADDSNLRLFTCTVPRARKAKEAPRGGLFEVESSELKKFDIQFEIVSDIHARCGMFVRKDFFA